MIVGVLPKPPRFLELAEVLTLHEAAIDEFGGKPGVRDHGLLESAISMPRQTVGEEFVHPMPFGMAAAYAFHICKNHPFHDGNKRAALATMVVFLRLNGWELNAPGLLAADRILAVADGSVGKDSLAAWIQSACRPRPTVELRDFLRNLDYARLATTFASIAAGPVEERVQTMMEAGVSVPAVHQATLGALAAETAGDVVSAGILRQHAMLLTALYRIAEDMGYEW